MMDKMVGRTFVIGDVHGETGHLFKLLGALPELKEGDTLTFLGDYVDRGPDSKELVDFVMGLSRHTKAKVVCLRGNHEDAWLRVVDRGWDGFVGPPGNGCLAALRSYTGGPTPVEGELPRREERMLLQTGHFFPEEVIAWMRSLLFWYEDEHAIYVHAGIPRGPDGFPHPRDVQPQTALLWTRDIDFFTNYRGKRIVVGHTCTEYLPPELSSYTPEDPTDLWAGECVVAIDTGCGNGGFLTCLELPSGNVYESR